jgi:hypothetical protein
MAERWAPDDAEAFVDCVRELVDALLKTTSGQSMPKNISSAVASVRRALKDGIGRLRCLDHQSLEDKSKAKLFALLYVKEGVAPLPRVLALSGKITVVAQLLITVGQFLHHFWRCIDAENKVQRKSFFDQRKSFFDYAFRPLAPALFRALNLMRDGNAGPDPPGSDDMDEAATILRGLFDYGRESDLLKGKDYVASVLTPATEDIWPLVLRGIVIRGELKSREGVAEESAFG